MAGFAVFGNQLPARHRRWTRSSRRKVRRGIFDHYLALETVGALGVDLREALRTEYAKAGGDPDELDNPERL